LGKNRKLGLPRRSLHSKTPNCPSKCVREPVGGSEFQGEVSHTLYQKGTTPRKWRRTKNLQGPPATFKKGRKKAEEGRGVPGGSLVLGQNIWVKIHRADTPVVKNDRNMGGGGIQEISCTRANQRERDRADPEKKNS